MFFKSCTILMTVIIACHSACNTRVEKCDESISKKFLGGPRLEPTPLAVYQEKSYWGAAAPNNTKVYTFKIKYNSFNEKDNKCTGVFTPYTKQNIAGSSKNLAYSESRSENTSPDKLYVISNEFTATYSMKCGKDAILEYRCQVEGAGSGFKYAVLLPETIKAYVTTKTDDVSVCINKIKEIDSSCGDYIERKKYP